MAFTTPPQRTQDRSSSLSVGTVVAGLVGGFTIVLMLMLLGGPLSSLDMLSAETRRMIGYGLLLLVGLLSGFIVAIVRAPSGLLAAVVAGLSAAVLLFLIRATLLSGGSYNPLVFGNVGLISAAVATIAGGGIALLLDGNGLKATHGLPPVARTGLWAACLWLGFELIARQFGAAGLGQAIGNALAGDMIGIAVGMGIAAWIIARYGFSSGISFEDWEYRWTPKAIGFGVAGAVVTVILMWFSAQVDLALWDMPENALAAFSDGLQAGAWVAALLLLANGVVGPICEEIAWRGVAQTAFVRAWGAAVGIVVAMALFALKHVLLDASLTRITTLLMLGLVLGVVRHRWGTGSSSVTHVLVNLYSTSVVIATA